MAKQDVRTTVTAKQAAEILDVSLMTLHRLLNAGEIEFYRKTGAPRSPRMVYVDSLVRYAKEKQGRTITLPR